jgi:Cu/Ag efflux pump CusA
MNQSFAPNTTRLQALTCSVRGASLRVNQIVLTVFVVVISLITILRGTG